MLLSKNDPSPFKVYNETCETPVLLVCDHAGNEIPENLKLLGLPREVLETHIAIDLGCRDLAIALSDLMKSTLIIASYSRLTIDLNRSPYDETLITPISDGIEIPGNQNLSTIDQKSRVEEIFDPYHAAIDREIKRLQGRQSRVGVISMHSFTPSMGGRSRPWEIGILWAKDDRISRPLINSLRSEIDLCIGDNEPYDARENYGYTVESHGEKAEIPGVLIEVRQDLIDSDLGVKKWADKIFQHLNPILLDLALSND